MDSSLEVYNLLLNMYFYLKPVKVEIAVFFDTNKTIKLCLPYIITFKLVYLKFQSQEVYFRFNLPMTFHSKYLANVLSSW